MATADGTVAVETPGALCRGRRYALLAVIGEVATETQREAVRRSLERGLRSWDIDFHSCRLNQQLKLFITSHLAHFSSEVKAFKTEHEYLKGCYKEEGQELFSIIQEHKTQNYGLKIQKARFQQLPDCQSSTTMT